MEYYVFATKAEADACVKYINSDMGWYPIVGNAGGIPRPDNQQTLRWVDAPVEMKDGSWAVPKIPDDRFDFMKVPVSEQDKLDLLAANGKDVRDLDSDSFVGTEMMLS